MQNDQSTIRNRPNFARLTMALLVFCIGLVPGEAPAVAPTPAPPPPDAGADDIFLLQASVSPNVVLVIDNSASMSHIEWHPAFDQEKTPDGTYCANSSDVAGKLGVNAALDPDVVYTVTSDETGIECNGGRGRRTVYGPENPTLWSGRYLMWYLGLDKDDSDDAIILNEIKNATAQVAGCTQAGGSGDFDQKYRRRRFEATKQVLLDLLCLAEPKNVRFGSAAFRVPEDAAGTNPNGGFISEDLGRSNPNHAAQLEASIKNENIRSTDGTPLSETMFQLYTYWMPRVTADMPVNAVSGTAFPIYEFNKSSDRAASNQWFEDSFLFECEKAFFVIVTDGLPTQDNFFEDPTDTSNTALGYSDFMDLIGNYHTDAEVEDPMTADAATYYLDDIAKYMFDMDFRPDLAGDQTIDTYTVGFATDTSTDTFLRRTALLGNGTFYHVKDGDELTFALIAALNDIIEKAASFTAATVPSARTDDGADFYQSFFFPRGKSAFWEGHIRAWKIDAAGDIKDKNDNCALEDPDVSECNSGPFKPAAVFYWDAAEEMPLPSARNLYVSKTGVTAGAVPPAFTQAVISAADLEVDVFAIPPDPAPNSGLYAVNGSTATTEEGLADEIVEAVRGCFFGSGVSTDVATPSSCAVRPSRLGDVFHSNAVVVRRPSQQINEPSYQAFSTHYEDRSRYLFAGTNAGFLEAFHTGTVVSGKYDEGTGIERFGFMPWEPRVNIKNLPIDAANDRTHYVDGDVNAADVWIHPSASTATKAANGSEWRSYVAGTLREGGHQFYALDVTNPDGINPPGGGSPLAFPGYGWEFPNEVDAAGDIAFMGETWSKPVITKIKLKDPSDASKTVERWVAVVTGGYDGRSDPNPDIVTGITGAYDATSTIGRGVYILDMKTGGVIAEKKFGSAADHQAAMVYSTLSTTAVLDLDFDGFADTIYIPDMGGQMFKWSISKPGEDRVNDGSGLRTQPNWRFKLFFQASAQTIGTETYYKNLMFPPAATFTDGELYLAFGSGERRNLPFEGDAGATTENNRFYIVRDSDPFERSVVALVTLTESDLTDFSASDGAGSFTNSGYFFHVADGEKFVTNVEIFAGYVIAASFIPTTSANPCTTRGNGALYAFDIETGEGYFTDGASNPDRSITLGAGLPTDPKVSVGSDGKNNKVVIEKSGSDIEIIDQENVNLIGGSLYWREE